MKIHQVRARVVEQMRPIVAEYYAAMSLDREQIDITYRSELNERSLEELLAASREKDLVNGFTTCGVHRDDILFTIGDMPLRKYGSQGQQKSFLIALKMAQYRIIADERGEVPILLLDDVFDKLDEGRVGELMRLVAGEGFGQIVITDCNRERMVRALAPCGAEHTIFDVTYGRVIE